MQFNDVLNDIELLINRELLSVNPNTDPTIISKVDRELQKYYVLTKSSNKAVARSIRELEDIWNELVQKGFSNVDQALYGGGSSRHQPETIFANLPYIQHFKYKVKKHLLLRNSSVHELGELSELQGAELRTIRKKIENHKNLVNQNVADTQSKLLASLSNSLDSVFKKYPGDSSINEIETVISKLKSLELEVRDSIVTLDTIESTNTTQSVNEVETLIEREQELPLDSLIDDEVFTGVENAENDNEKDLYTPKGRPRIRPYTPTLSLIFDRLSHHEIELQPDFQRKDRIWNNTKKSKLIESIFLELPLPAFYFGEKSDGSWIVVDGVQRITSIYDYISGVFELENLSVLKEYNDLSFKDLNRRQQRMILEYTITSHLIDVASDHNNMIVELFHRINTYGVKLSDQEIRSALNQGSSVAFLRYVAGLNEFKIATTFKIKADRQKDMELCLSGIAFIVLGYEKYVQNQYGYFLSSAMKKLNKYSLSISNKELVDEGKSSLSDNSSDVYLSLEKRIVGAFNLAAEVFGDFAFKKEAKAERKIPISKPLFELIITYFSALDEQQRLTVLNNTDELIDTLYEAIDTNSADYAKWSSDKYADEGRGFAYSISTSTGKNVTVKYRFEAFKEILKRSTGVDVKLTPLIPEV